TATPTACTTAKSTDIGWRRLPAAPTSAGGPGPDIISQDGGRQSPAERSWPAPGRPDRFKSRNILMALIRRNRRPGFTLIELLVVIAIIAILAAILFPFFAP